MEKKADSKDTAFEAAKRYVDQQLETMKQHGSAPRLTQRDYDALIRKVVAAAQ
jgi:hypothetical protein